MVRIDIRVMRHHTINMLVVTEFLSSNLNNKIILFKLFFQYYVCKANEMVDQLVIIFVSGRKTNLDYLSVPVVDLFHNNVETDLCYRVMIIKKLLYLSLFPSLSI